MKKILAVIFIVMGSLLGLAIIAQIPKVIGLILLIFSADANQIAYSLAYAGLMVIFSAVAVILFRYGIRWLRKPSSSQNTDVLDEDLIQNDVD